MRVGGAVLTGGRSSRMGVDKALLLVDGVPMAERVASALQEAGCEPVILVGGDTTPLDALGHRVVPDLVPGRRGPVAGIHAALSELTDECDAVVVAACDLPDLHSAVVERLVQAAAAAREFPAAVVAHTGRREPLCVLWNTSCAPVLARRLEGQDPSVMEVLDGLAEVLEVSATPEHLRNVNTPSDVRR